MTATSVVFDSWAWFEILEGTAVGKRLWKKYANEAWTIHTSVLAYAEVAAKVARLGTADDVEAALSLLESRARFHGATLEQARRAAIVRVELRRKKPGAGLLDALILAGAEALGLDLVSGDRAFAGRANVRTD